MGLKVLECGPAVALQDLGRPGHLGLGMMRGGAADVLALHEGAALLGQSPNCAVLEMAGIGGTFEATHDTIIALTGAKMRAFIDDQAILWNASHALPRGSRLTIGPVLDGSFGYLHVSGGFQTPEVIGSRASHLTIGLGRLVQGGDVLPLLPPQGDANRTLPADTRFSGGDVRIVPSAQTHRFPEPILKRFAETTFQRDPRANRQAIGLTFDGDGFADPSGLSVVSEIVTPGDIQITGDGTPYILSVECQTTGGYPRIGTVIPSDFPKVAQAPAGTALRFGFVTLDEGCEIEAKARKRVASLANQVTPLVRDPREMDDLLSYNLISGATAGD